MSGDETLTYEEAVAMLPDDDRIHTYVQGGPCLIGADWDREDILSLIREQGARLTGPDASSRKHGLAVLRRSGPLFIETKSDTHPQPKE